MPDHRRDPHVNKKAGRNRPSRPPRHGQPWKGKPNRKPGFRPRRKAPGRPLKPLVDARGLDRGPYARYQALRLLVQADESGRFIDQLLEERVHSQDIESRDRYLIQEIAYGAIRHRNTIDFVLDGYIQFSMRRHNASVRWGLRLASYQLIYLSRIPPHAAIHGTLEAMKALGGVHERDVGFANAVLRRLHNDIREKTEEIPANKHDRAVLPARHGVCIFNRPVLPAPAANRTLFLAVKYSHPKWLLARWLERFGEEDTIPLCLENNRIPLVSAILTGRGPGKEEIVHMLEDEEITVEPGSVPEAIRLRRPGDVRRLVPFQERWIRIQDETAKRIGDALDPPPGARVLDLCAGPGSKAAQILEAIGPDGHLTACDVDDQKLLRLRQNLQSLGENFSLVKLPREPGELPLEESFTHILVDAPCSNTGVLARRPESRWRIHQTDLANLARLQVRLLDSAVRRLAPRGRLVYATCSIEPDENGQVVGAIRRRYPRLGEASSRLFLPHRDGADGGYYCVLQAPSEGWSPGS